MATTTMDIAPSSTHEAIRLRVSDMISDVESQIKTYISEQRARDPLQLSHGRNQLSPTNSKRRPPALRPTALFASPTSLPGSEQSLLNKIFDSPECRTQHSPPSVSSCQLRRRGATFHRVNEATANANDSRSRIWEGDDSAVFRLRSVSDSALNHTSSAFVREMGPSPDSNFLAPPSPLVHGLVPAGLSPPCPGSWKSGEQASNPSGQTKQASMTDEAHLPYSLSRAPHTTSSHESLCLTSRPTRSDSLNALRKSTFLMLNASQPTPTTSVENGQETVPLSPSTTIDSDIMSPIELDKETIAAISFDDSDEWPGDNVDAFIADGCTRKDGGLALAGLMQRTDQQETIDLGKGSVDPIDVDDSVESSGDNADETTEVKGNEDMTLEGIPEMTSLEASTNGAYDSIDDALFDDGDEWPGDDFGSPFTIKRTRKNNKGLILAGICPPSNSAKISPPPAKRTIKWPQSRSKPKLMQPSNADSGATTPNSPPSLKRPEKTETARKKGSARKTTPLHVKRRVIAEGFGELFSGRIFQRIEVDEMIDMKKMQKTHSSLPSSPSPAPISSSPFSPPAAALSSPSPASPALPSLPTHAPLSPSPASSPSPPLPTSAIAPPPPPPKLALPSIPSPAALPSLPQKQSSKPKDDEDAPDIALHPALRPPSPPPQYEPSTPPSSRIPIPTEACRDSRNDAGGGKLSVEARREVACAIAEEEVALSSPPRIRTAQQTPNLPTILEVSPFQDDDKEAVADSVTSAIVSPTNPDLSLSLEVVPDLPIPVQDPPLSPRFLHGPIRLTNSTKMQHERHLRMSCTSGELDWTAFQIAIGGPTGDYLMGGETSTPNDSSDDLVGWFDSFPFISEGRMIRSDVAGLEDVGIGAGDNTDAEEDEEEDDEEMCTTPVELPVLDPSDLASGRTSASSLSTVKGELGAGELMSPRACKMSANLTDLGDYLSAEMVHLGDMNTVDGY